MEATSPKRVAIIGAGVSGLTALKECLAAGLSASVFEARSEIGGQWAYQDIVPTPTSSSSSSPGGSKDDTGSQDEPPPPLQSSIYDGVMLNSCRDTTAFSDFPLDPARYGDYFGHRKMLRYIREYAAHFGLEEHITFRSKVLKCVPKEEDGDEEDRWIVEVQGVGGGKVEQREYDAVIDSTGMNTAPHIPSWPGREHFQGEFLHSHSYRRPGRFEGKRVAVIGLGSTAVDIASELAACAASSVHVVARRGAWVFPRFVLGRPLEAWDSRASQTWVSPRVAEYLQRVLLNFVQGRPPAGLEPEHGMFEQNPTVRSEFWELVRNGAVEVHRCADGGGVERFSDEGVVLSDGTALDVDVVIACTGYRRGEKTCLPADALRDAHTPDCEVDLYKLVVPLRYRNLYVSGYVETFGPALPAVEAQARYIAAAISGRVGVPQGAELERAVRAGQAGHAARGTLRTPRHDCLEMFVPYIDSLVGELGATPTVGRLLGDVFASGRPLEALATLSAVLFGVTSSAQWRLFGGEEGGRKTAKELARETTLRTAREGKALSGRERELLGL